jgi:hypothetical protein
MHEKRPFKNVHHHEALAGQADDIFASACPAIG